jgi:fluoride exporter
VGMGPVLLLGVAGGFGAVARYSVAEWLALRWVVRFPAATFVINVTGAFALGLVLSVGGAHASGSAPVRAILGTGFLGGYTTFSALSFETHALARGGEARRAWLNGLASLVCGAGAVALGVWLGSLL